MTFIATLLLTGMIIPPIASSLTKIHSLPHTYQMSDSRCHLVDKFVYIRMEVTVVRLLLWCNIHITSSNDSWRLGAIVLVTVVVSAVAVGQRTSRAAVLKLLVSADQLQIFSNFVDILPKIMSTRGPLNYTSLEHLKSTSILETLLCQCKNSLQNYDFPNSTRKYS
jgi:hypothetical protein